MLGPSEDIMRPALASAEEPVWAQRSRTDYFAECRYFSIRVFIIRFGPSHSLERLLNISRDAGEQMSLVQAVLPGCMISRCVWPAREYTRRRTEMS